MRFLHSLLLPLLLILCHVAPIGSKAARNHVDQHQQQFTAGQRFRRSLTDPMALESEGGESVENSIENLNLEDLTVQKEKKEKELNDLETTLNKAKKAVEDKQTDEAKKPLDDYNKKKEEWEKLDALAKGMTKELKDATAEFNTAKLNSINANATSGELERLNAALLSAKDKRTRIDEASTRLPLAKGELDKLKSDCKNVESEKIALLEFKEEQAKEALRPIQEAYTEQEDKVKKCPKNTDCNAMKANLDNLKKELNPAVLALTKASEAIVLHKECPGNKTKLEAEVALLEDPDKARGDADLEIKALDDQIKDPKYANAEEIKKKADDEYTKKTGAKLEAESKNQYKPQQVTKAEADARKAKLDLGDLEPAKTTYEDELAKLKTDVEEQQKKYDEKKAEVGKLTDLYDAKKQEKGGEPGTGNVGMVAGAIVGVVVVVAVIAAVVVTKKKKMFCFADKGDAKKRCITYKETDNADGASGKQSDGTGSQQGSNKAPKKRPGIGAPGSNQE